MLRREGLLQHHKRTFRLYTEQRLPMRTKKRRKLPAARPGGPHRAGAADAAVVVGLHERSACRSPTLSRSVTSVDAVGIPGWPIEVIGQAACVGMLRSGIDEREGLDLHVAVLALPVIVLLEAGRTKYASQA
ncbi:hypothetical protein [Roseivivax halodurans]|nr:hypothetical protein [Roseivivax halodurans]